MMLAYHDAFAWLESQGLSPMARSLEAAVAEALEPSRNGHWPRWLPALDALPDVTFPVAYDITSDVVRIGNADTLSSAQQAHLSRTLKAFHPWRKGPYACFGTEIVTEWRSDWKWRRMAELHPYFAGARVLDIGCGNGYFGWRMLGCGAKAVLGVDPFLAYTVQYQVVRRYLPNLPNWVLPVGLECLPTSTKGFDVVSSLGVLYHRRDPIAHLKALLGWLESGGRVMVETLVIDGGPGEVLQPKGRYAKMRNVHVIPSVPTLEAWLREAGFRDVALIDVTPTTTQEQRATPWMTFESLSDFLDPHDQSHTIEGHPAPVRAIITGQA